MVLDRAIVGGLSLWLLVMVDCGVRAVLLCQRLTAVSQI